MRFMPEDRGIGQMLDITPCKKCPEHIRGIFKTISCKTLLLHNEMEYLVTANSVQV